MAGHAKRPPRRAILEEMDLKDGKKGFGKGGSPGSHGVEQLCGAVMGSDEGS